MNKKVKFFLLGSMMVNVLLIGILVGHFSHHFRQGFYKKENFKNLEMLPQEKRALIEQALKTFHQNQKQEHKEIDHMRKEIFTALTAPTFDPKKYEEYVEKLHILHGNQVKNMSTITKTLAMKLNQEERKILAKHLRRSRPESEGKPRPQKKP